MIGVLWWVASVDAFANRWWRRWLVLSAAHVNARVLNVEVVDLFEKIYDLIYNQMV
jgi:hypothetical protein